MTTTVINYDSSSTFDFSQTVDDLVILSDGSIAPSSGAAIATEFGGATVTIEGSAIGQVGFFDSTGEGHDFVSVGQSGSLVGTVNSAFIGGNDCVITNAGFIDGMDGCGIQSGSGNIIDNEGHVDGYTYAIVDDGGDSINNSGTLYALGFEGATVLELAGSNTIVNSGLIASNGGAATLDLEGEFNTVTNTGTIDGANIGVGFASGFEYLSNCGTISGLVNAIYTGGSEGSDVVRNSGLIESEQASGTAILFEDSGENDVLVNSGTIWGSVAFSGADATVHNSGEIDGSVGFSLGSAVVRNTGDISGDIYFTGNDNFYYGAYATVEGLVYCSGSVGYYFGGARGTEFVVQASQLERTDTIVGGASADDALDIEGAGAVTALDLKNVSGFETIGLGDAVSIYVTEALANSAAGHALTIETGASDVVNLAGVTSAADAITVWGEASNMIIAGASLDTFGFDSAASSTGPSYDTIVHVNFARDEFDVSLTGADITGINKATSGSLSTATFNTDLAADLGPTKLGADHAVLFTASAGSLKGDTFLVVDCNDTAGYTVGADLVIRLAGATGTLTAGNFI